MNTKKDKFVLWFKAGKAFHGFWGKYYWLFKYRVGNYSTWKEFKDSLK